MIQRLAPWRRNMIALARGITLAPSGQMKWMANIFVDDIKRGDMYSYFPFPADNPHEAAREVARVMAKRLYGEQGEATFVNQTEDGLFKANIGVYQGAGVTKGRSLSILLREYRGIQ